MFQENNNDKCKSAWQTPILIVPRYEKSPPMEVEGKQYYQAERFISIYITRGPS